SPFINKLRFPTLFFTVVPSTIWQVELETKDQNSSHQFEPILR
ncbi:unnamed protein product, partial [Arabidopsis halleri]